jgi:hypothetical protein
MLYSVLTCSSEYEPLKIKPPYRVVQPTESVLVGNILTQSSRKVSASTGFVVLSTGPGKMSEFSITGKFICKESR